MHRFIRFFFLAYSLGWYICMDMPPENEPQREKPKGVRWATDELREINEAAKVARIRPVDVIRIGAVNLARIIKRTRTVPIEPPSPP
jgi:hypothetical protein